MPDIPSLQRHMQRLAALESVFAVDNGAPQFFFNPRWRTHEQVATSKNGSGDELYIHFTPAGCFIKGFAHESEMTAYNRADRSVWPGVLDSVPSAFDSSLKEPAFAPDATTFAIWRLATDAAWSTGAVKFPPDEYKDGSAELLRPITCTRMDFAEWLVDNYETDIDLDVIVSVFDGQPLSDQQLLALNPSSPVQALREAVRATGYPLEGGQ